MTFPDLLEWWNLIFVLPFLSALAYLLLMTFGLVAAEHGAEMEADTDAGHADIGHDLDVQHDLDVHGDIDHALEAGAADAGAAEVVQGEVVTGDGAGHGLEASAPHHADVEPDDWGGLGKVLSFLGLGRIPLSIILMCFCFIWGFAGLAANQVFRSIFLIPGVFVWPALGVALVCSVLFTRLLALSLGRVLPSSESYGVTNEQLVGKRAVVRFKVTEASGSALLHDSYGNLREVPCRVRAGEEPLPQGTRVVLMDYEQPSRAFLIRVDPLEEQGLDYNPARGMLK